MDREGFRELLKSRKLNDEQIEASIAIAERFEEYLVASGETADGQQPGSLVKSSSRRDKTPMIISSPWRVMAYL